MRSLVALSQSLGILSLLFSANCFAFEEIDLSTYCRTDPPPSGYSGPNPTNFCRLSWTFESGAPKTDYVEAWSEIRVTNPSVGLTDFASTEFNMQELQSSDEWFWVVQVVCTVNLQTIRVKLDAFASGFMIIQLPWVVRTQNSHAQVEAQLREANCPS